MDRGQQALGVLKDNKRTIFFSVVGVILLTIVILLIIVLNTDNQTTIRNSYLAGNIVFCILSGFMSIMFWRCWSSANEAALENARLSNESSQIVQNENTQLQTMLSNERQEKQRLASQIANLEAKMTAAESKLQSQPEPQLESQPESVESQPESVESFYN